ncbi:MAG: hypothetical protein SXG53_28855, partial [Pseudomonadota bacterium]|nr:hypothetical protein [Pseudomonadota bacterium]
MDGPQRAAVSFALRGAARKSGINTARARSIETDLPALYLPGIAVGTLSMILEIRNLFKTFQSTAHHEPVEVLKDLNLTMERGETLAILGQS